MIVADNLLLAHSQLRARSSASDSQVRQLKRWLLSNNRDAILPPESAFIETGVDLVPLVPQSMGLVRQFLEDHLSAKHLSQMFPAGKKAGRVSWAYYTSNRGINASLAFCGIAMAVLALVGPLWILHVLDDPTKRLGITTGFMSFSHWS